jgi:N-dimethylarginine dimethylaminohydrolase
MSDTPSNRTPGSLSEVGTLTRVVVKDARHAFVSEAAIAAQWRTLGFTAPPDFARAVDESERFIELVASAGCQVDRLPARPETSLDSIYVRDASLVCDRGVILCAMGKPARAAEPAAQAASLREWGVPVAGVIEPPGAIEGGDVVWLDSRHVVAGRGYRTNDEGIRQFRALLGDTIDTFTVVPLPHWRGAGDVFHLMSMISPIDRDLLLVYARLLPVSFRELLLERGYELVDVPDEEFESTGTNVLALAPRRCLMVNGNPRTRALLERTGADVQIYEGNEISHKGGGGPTCLTRPLSRLEP